VIRPVLEEGGAPAIGAAAAVLGGILLGAWSATGSAPSVVLLLLSLGVLAIEPPGDRARRRSAVRRLAFAAFWFAAGFVGARTRIAVPASTARSAFERLTSTPGRADLVEGVLEDFWSGAPPRARSKLKGDRVCVGGRWLEFPAEVAVFVAGQTPVEPVADRGDRVRLTGHLELEDLPASDREIPLPWGRYTLSVKSARMIERTGGSLRSALAWPNRRLFSRLSSAAAPVFGRDVRGPVAALLLGRTSELDRGLVAHFRRGGLYHLLVVSGLHVVLAVGLAAGLLGLAGIEGKVRDLALLAVATLFVIVAGAKPPAVRAGLVVGVFLLTRLLERPITGAQAIGLSALVLLLFDPAQAFSVGTVLTFAAVFGIALLARPIRAVLPERPGWLFSGLAVALAAECATAPVLLWRFNLVAAGAWLTAPLAIPLATGLIGAGASLLLCGLAGAPPGPLPAMLAGGSRALEFLAERSSGAAFLRPTPPLWAVVLVGGLVAAAGLARGTLRGFTAAAAALLFAVLALRRGPGGPERGFSVEALDVGQGDAILVRWKRRAILVDGGGPFDLAATDFGRTHLVPKLLDRGVTRLDAAVLTHPHPDHALGLVAVLEELEVAALWLPAGEDLAGLEASLEEAAARNRIPVRVLEPGWVFARDGARLDVLHSGGRRRKLDAVNERSVVALFSRDGRTALLTGDAGAPTERELMDAGALWPVDLLKVGHHGSRTATSSEFLCAVRPRVALLSCGRRNRFGHPAPETLEALRVDRVPVLRTDARSDCRVELAPDATRLWWRGVPP
jgi:competence protein ComEC